MGLVLDRQKSDMKLVDCVDMEKEGEIIITSAGKHRTRNSSNVKESEQTKQQTLQM